jgi:large subunit ribosomal protein L28
MAKICPITKVGSRMVGGYSNSVRATKYNPIPKARKYPNLQKKKVYVPELKATVSLELSTRAIRTINKRGAFITLKKAGLLG